MYQEIKEKVKVRADFDGGQIRPVLIKWRTRDYKVQSLNLVSQEREGASINYYFAIDTDSGNCIKLKYNNLSFVWSIEELWTE